MAPVALVDTEKTDGPDQSFFTIISFGADGYDLNNQMWRIG